MSVSKKTLARRKYQQQWRDRNRERVRAYSATWRAENPDKVKQYQDRYWAKQGELLEK
ncbi:hypothetical protein [Jeotgalibacillus terrae]|uniref:Uncharacterized protein n=1 Tax=Jeotgalibacillus terrae TaxID=587735 RepID=A0ABW5ZM05_9BACL|nr:hypothetical protein [Jeotgalibacillus terrae]MBM7581076.1 hypothetical protein [Jeotgalibacillus terrae]